MSKMKMKKNFSFCLLLLALTGGLVAGCEDRMDEEVTPIEENELVTVSLMLDFASETDGYDLATGSPQARHRLATGSPQARHRLALKAESLSARASAPKC